MNRFSHLPAVRSPLRLRQAMQCRRVQQFLSTVRHLPGAAFSLAFILTAGCDSSPVSSIASATVPPVGTLVAPLSGASASNEARMLESIRHLPKRAPFERRTFTNASRTAELKYLLLKPKNFDRNRSYPLVLSLHGGAPRRHFEDLLEPYLPGLAYGLGRLVSDETQDNHPCFVVAPWSDQRNWDDRNLRLTLELLDHLGREFRVDTNRVYVTGQSMGGFGTWSMILEQPGRFAAAIPICGGGDPRRARAAAHVPIWAFHGSADGVVPVSETRAMIAAIQAAGGTPIYWEYQHADHSATAERAYCEPALIDWLFAQSKTNRTSIQPPPPP